MILNNIERFSPAIIDAVHWASKEFPKGRVVFCGSFGLVLNGLLDREIHDIDLLTEENWYGASISEYCDNDILNNRGNSGRYWVDGIAVFCFKMDSPSGVTLDILHRREKQFNVEYEEVEFFGQKILVEKPDFAIKAKKRYLQSDQLQYRDKHIKDLKEIESNQKK